MNEDKKLKAKDKRLQRLYGITLEDYNQMLQDQVGVCAICGRYPIKVPLSVDHDHKWKYLKVRVEMTLGIEHGATLDTSDPAVMLAPVQYRARVGFGRTTKEARQDLKEKLKRASIRGLLCFRCNGGLRKYDDRPERMEKAAAYLRKHQEGK